MTVTRYPEWDRLIQQIRQQNVRALFADDDDYERLWPDEMRALRVHGEWLGERPMRRHSVPRPMAMAIAT